MTEIARKLSVDNIEVIQVELQSKNQSRMNQRYSFHDLYPVINGTVKRYYLEPTVIRKINTRNYKCYEENNLEQTKCLNHFYMSKLNCTFPWLESTKQSQEKCGSKHLIKDLVNLIDNVSDLIDNVSAGKYSIILGLS